MQLMQIYVSESEYHIRNMKTALQIAAFCTVWTLHHYFQTRIIYCLMICFIEFPSL